MALDITSKKIINKARKTHYKPESPKIYVKNQVNFYFKLIIFIFNIILTYKVVNYVTHSSKLQKF